MEHLSIDTFKQMFRAALGAVTARADEFSQLDAVIGDGDHGTAIVQALTSAASAFEKEGDFKTLLNDAGFNVMLQTSGSTSTLLGGWLLGMSDASEGIELDAQGVKRMFRGGWTGVSNNTKAQPGDKTMMDALVPAVEAMEATEGTDICSLFRAAAHAALQGARSTVEMKANFGRARNYGERSVGFPDSGATSWACMFEAFYKTIVNE